MLILVQRKRKPEYMPESSWNEKIFIDGELEIEISETCDGTQTITSGDIVRLVTKAFYRTGLVRGIVQLDRKLSS